MKNINILNKIAKIQLVRKNYKNTINKKIFVKIQFCFILKLILFQNYFQYEKSLNKIYFTLKQYMFQVFL